MLNGFSKDECPICKIPLLTNNNHYFYCNTENNNYYHFEMGLSQGKVNYESVIIDNHYITFYPDRFQYIIHNGIGFQHKSKIIIKDSPIQFKDLDTSEKIEEFIRNYKILC